MEVPETVAHLKHVAESEGIKYEEEALNVIARKADGGMRDALSIFDQVASFTNGNITYAQTIENLNVLDYDYYFEVTDRLLEVDIPQVMLLLDKVLKQGLRSRAFHRRTGRALPRSAGEPRRTDPPAPRSGGERAGTLCRTGGTLHPALPLCGAETVQRLRHQLPHGAQQAPAGGTDIDPSGTTLATRGRAPFRASPYVATSPHL